MAGRLAGRLARQMADGFAAGWPHSCLGSPPSRLAGRLASRLTLAGRRDCGWLADWFG